MELSVLAPSVESVANFRNSHARRLSLQVFVIPILVPPQLAFPSGALISPQRPRFFCCGSLDSMLNLTDQVAQAVKMCRSSRSASFHAGVQVIRLSEICSSRKRVTSDRERPKTFSTLIFPSFTQTISDCSCVNCRISSSENHI